jgi:hypothetical protein
MKLNVILFLFSFLFLCSTTVCFAQVSFYAEASPLEVAKNEYVTYKLTIENGEGEAGIKPPSFAGFKVMGAPSESSSKQLVVNGTARKFVQSISLTYILQAKQAGNYKIPSCTASIAGSTYSCNAVDIVVTNNTSNNNKPIEPISVFGDLNIFDAPKRQQQFSEHELRNGDNDIQTKVAKNMHFNLQLSKSTCFVGEPIMANYKLFTRLPTESNLEKFPSFNGFSVIDMTEDYIGNNYAQEKLDGKMYNAYTICSAQLYPLQAGVITIDASTLNNKVNFAKYDASNNGTLITEDINLLSKPQQLNVLPLPEKNKPVNFAGSVGSFIINAVVEKNSFSTSDLGKLQVTITGTGNMQLLTLPKIDWPANFEIFDVKSTDNITNNTMPISGSKVFEIPFAISKVGSCVIPKISFSFFNPATKQYQTVQTEDIKLEIVKGVNFLQPN